MGLQNNFWTKILARRTRRARKITFCKARAGLGSVYALSLSPSSSMSAPKRQKTAGTAVAISELEATVRAAVSEVEVVDLHTHLMPPSFGEMMLWGVDELLTYHYLVCEFFQTATDIRPNEFYALPKVCYEVRWSTRLWSAFRV